MTQGKSLLTPPKMGESSWLATGAKAFAEMVRASDRNKYVSKMPCEWSIDPPGHVSVPPLDKKKGGLMGQTWGEEKRGVLQPCTALPG